MFYVWCWRDYPSLVVEMITSSLTLRLENSLWQWNLFKYCLAWGWSLLLLNKSLIVKTAVFHILSHTAIVSSCLHIQAQSACLSSACLFSYTNTQTDRHKNTHTPKIVCFQSLTGKGKQPHTDPWLKVLFPQYLLQPSQQSKAPMLCVTRRR